jgi:hypothetical protein
VIVAAVCAVTGKIKEVFCMKKLLAVVLLMCMLVPCAVAEDYTAYTTEELHAIVDAARNELTKRELAAKSNLLVFDDYNVQIYMTGNGRPWEYGGKKYFYLEFIVINGTEYNIAVDFIDMSINGWNVGGGNISKTMAGKKNKDTIILSLTGANLDTYTGIEDVETTIAIRSADTGDELYTASEPIRMHFNW